MDIGRSHFLLQHRHVGLFFLEFCMLPLLTAWCRHYGPLSFSPPEITCDLGLILMSHGSEVPCLRNERLFLGLDPLRPPPSRHSFIFGRLSCCITGFKPVSGCLSHSLTRRFPLYMSLVPARRSSIFSFSNPQEDLNAVPPLRSVACQRGRRAQNFSSLYSHGPPITS